LIAVACSHDTYRSITTSYDRERRLLVYFWTCDKCGAYLQELRRRKYEPRYEPRYGRQPGEAQVGTLGLSRSSSEGGAVRVG
jgi:hypothetical protein